PIPPNDPEGISLATVAKTMKPVMTQSGRVAFKRILLVDDEPLVRETIRLVLGQADRPYEANYRDSTDSPDEPAQWTAGSAISPRTQTGLSLNLSSFILLQDLQDAL